MDDIVIKVEHVSKDFVLPHERITSVKSAFTNFYKRRKRTRETQHALRDISFEIKKGEFFGIVGRNGSGKSTMLKILANIYQPTKGTVSTRGKLVPFIELGVGFNPELTGRENVYLNGAMLGFSRKEVDAMYREIVSFAELERFMDQKLKNYSSGMQVRLAFSMAIRSEADVLLVDEVLAVGDADFQRKCFQYFEHLKSTKKTVVFVSHDMNAIRQYCDRAAMIEKNELVMIGNANDISDAYTKLFVKKRETVKKEEAGVRWGDASAEYSKPKIILAQAGEPPDKLTIEALLNVKTYMRKPLIGFSVRNTDGTVLFGTNTQLARGEVPELHPGMEIKISWAMPDILNEGNYSFDLSISHEGVMADWWEGAAKLRLVRENKNPYLVNPPAKFVASIQDDSKSQKP